MAGLPAERARAVATAGHDRRAGPAAGGDEPAAVARLAALPGDCGRPEGRRRLALEDRPGAADGRLRAVAGSVGTGPGARAEHAAVGRPGVGARPDGVGDAARGRRAPATAGWAGRRPRGCRPLRPHRAAPAGRRLRPRFPRDASMNVQTITVRHNRIELALHRLRDGADHDGGARPLLHLHGLGERSPAAMPDELTGWPGPVWGLDFTGHGASTVPVGGGYFCELLMADVDAALAHLGEATLYGRGLGAYVALLTAGARPELVRGAILDDGPGLTGGGGEPTTPYVL